MSQLVITLTEQDIRDRVRVYCLCHGWQQPSSLGDVCPEIYASS